MLVGRIVYAILMVGASATSKDKGAATAMRFEVTIKSNCVGVSRRIVDLLNFEERSNCLKNKWAKGLSRKPRRISKYASD
jgi:hypothetical protein